MNEWAGSLLLLVHSVLLLIFSANLAEHVPCAGLQAGGWRRTPSRAEPSPCPCGALHAGEGEEAQKEMIRARGQPAARCGLRTGGSPEEETGALGLEGGGTIQQTGKGVKVQPTCSRQEAERGKGAEACELDKMG